MDIKQYLADLVSSELQQEHASPESVVEAVLSAIESVPTEPEDENVIEYGVDVWLTLKNTENTTLKDIKDFIEQAQKMGLPDEIPVQGALHIEYPADAGGIWGEG